MLILPGDELFEETLASASVLMRPGFVERRAKLNGEFVLVYRPGSLLPEMVPMAEAQEYLLGGEYEERLMEIPDPDIDDDLVDLLTHPWEG